jgi:hypothetical protein
MEQCGTGKDNAWKTRARFTVVGGILLPRQTGEVMGDISGEGWKGRLLELVLGRDIFL